VVRVVVVKVAEVVEAVVWVSDTEVEVNVRLLEVTVVVVESVRVAEVKVRLDVEPVVEVDTVVELNDVWVPDAEVVDDVETVALVQVIDNMELVADVLLQGTSGSQGSSVAGLLTETPPPQSQHAEMAVWFPCS